MTTYLSGKYWWLGVTAIVLFTLLLFHSLQERNTISKPQPAPVKHIAAAPRPAPVPTHPVLDLFSPSAANITHDQAITRTRGELEQLLVIAILLQRCEIISENEYQHIYQAGSYYAEKSRLFTDTDALMRELFAAAQKTYGLVYAQTECTEPSLATLKIQTMEWQSRYTPK